MAKADRAQQLTEGWDTYYLEGVTDADLPVVQFVVVATSREPLIDHTVPERLPGTSLVRIRVNALRWSTADWCKVAGYPKNPYTHYRHPLIVRADWLVQQIADGTRSNSYLRLYFGGDKIPKTADEFYAAIGVDPKKQRGLSYGLVEGASRINRTPDAARLLRFDDGTHSECWTTLDVIRIVAGKDPLDVNGFKADGSEIFGLVGKVSTSGVRGLFPVTALADGNGKIVAEAPVSLVEDKTRFGNQAAVRNPGGCWQCHTAGPQRSGVNALRKMLKSGVELKVYSKQKQVELELFHLGEIDTALDRWEDGYTVALAAVNGLTPEENAKQCTDYFARYLLPVTPEIAADELGCDVEELAKALGYASANKIDLGTRLPGLAHGLPIVRDAWESEYLKVAEVLKTWRAIK